MSEENAHRSAEIKPGPNGGRGSCRQIWKSRKRARHFGTIRANLCRMGVAQQKYGVDRYPGQRHWVWVTLILSSVTIIAVVFAGWELVENRFFRDIDYVPLH